ACRRGAADARRIRRDDVAAPQSGRGGRQGVHRETARVQARDLARVRRESRRAPRERRRAWDAVPSRSGAAIDRRRTPRRSDRRYRAGVEVTLTARRIGPSLYLFGTPGSPTAIPASLDFGLGAAHL